MSTHDFDVIVVGGRCAGASTALLLARKGFEVLVVDRATFPSDTLSTHPIQPHGVRRLARWGLLDRVIASGCPPIDTYEFHFGPMVISGSPGTAEAPVAYCPRRTVLDEILIEAAVEAGAELRKAFHVDEVLTSQGSVVGIRGHPRGGPAMTVTAPLVVGADGRYSVVAKTVSPAVYDERPALQGGYYAYWSDLPVDNRFEYYVGASCGFAAAPTNDGLTMVVSGWPIAQYHVKKHDHERSYRSLLEGETAFRDRVRSAHLVSKVFGATTPNFFRKPFGPGWALVGDAGYLKDPITAQGISDAFRDAELLTRAIETWRAGAPYETSITAYQTARDTAARPMYDFTCQIAAMKPFPPDLLELIGATAGNQEAMDQFRRINAGVSSPAEFFDEENVRRILAARPASLVELTYAGNGEFVVSNVTGTVEAPWSDGNRRFFQPRNIFPLTVTPHGYTMLILSVDYEN